MPSQRTNTTVLSVSESAYLAGMIDADGCISLSVRGANGKRREVGNQLVIQTTVSLTHKPTIEWISKTTNSTNKIFYTPARSHKHKDVWTWRPPIYVAYTVLNQTVPYMITKKRQAEIFIELIDVRRKSTRTERNWDKQMELVTENKLLNRRGPNSEI